MEPDERFVDVDYRALSDAALRGLIEEFVSREGTDYGAQEASFDEKVRAVERQLESGEAKIVFDAVDDCANIVPTGERRRRRS